MKRNFAWFMVMVLMMVVFAGCASTDAASEPAADSPAAEEPAAESVTLKLGHMSPLENNYHLLSVKFKELVEERTDGRIMIEIYPQAQLGYDRDLLEAMQFGNVDMAVNTTAPISNFESLYGVLDLPYLFEDWDHIEAFIQSDVAKELLSESVDEGLVGLAIMPRGFRSVSNNVRAIESPADLEGIKLRVLESPSYVKTFEDLGAVVSAMSWGEVYTALQQGAIDGQENPPETVKTERVYEVQEYYSLTEHIAGFAAIMASGVTWDSLSQADQELIQEAAVEAAVYQGNVNRTNEDQMLADLEELGMKINRVDKSEFSALTTSSYEWFEGQFGEKYVQLIKDIK